MYEYTARLHTYDYNYNIVINHEILHNAAISFIKKMGIGSGISLLCGFIMAQARVARLKRQCHKSQSSAVNLVSLLPNLAAFQTCLMT